MSTKTKIKNPESNWIIKDRMYVLNGEAAPLTYTIQTKHTSKKPLLWFDESINQNRELRLASNQRSLFVDEQDGYATLQHIMFEDGVIMVPKTEPNVQKLLSIYHPKKVWHEIDDEIIANDEVEDIELELEALGLVQSLDISHIEAIMRTEMGSTVASLSSKELKRDAYNFARSNPALFIEISQDEDITLRNLANRAVETGIIMLTEDNTVFKFANGKKIITVPFDQNPYGALAQYFKTDEGVDLMKSISKKLS